MMFKNKQFTKKEIDKILDAMVILVDTREKDMRIVDELESKGITCVKKKLDFGDYSCGVIINSEKISLEDKIAIERKGSGNSGLDELSGNITASRDRFERELQRAKDKGAKLFLLIEDGDWYSIYNNFYRSNINKNSYLGTIFSYIHRYQISIDMVSKEHSSEWIYGVLRYYVRELLKD